MVYEDVGFAVVGLGMGRSRAKMVRDTPGARLVAVCDTDEARGARVRDELAVEWVPDYGRLLERDDVHVVFLFTPSGMHAEMGMAAARAGKHILCTKPLDTTLEKIDALIAACRQSGVLLGCDFDCRYMEDYRRIKRVVDAGKLGRLILGEVRLKWFRADSYYEGWHGTWGLDGGGSLMNQTVHLIDALLWMCGPVSHVTGRFGVFNHRIETEDLGMGLLEFRSGALGYVLGTTTFPEDRTFDLEVHGTKGAAVLSKGKPTYLKLEGDEPLRPPAQPANAVEDMVSALRNGTPLACDGPEARKSVQLIQAIYESARQHHSIALPP